MLKISECGKNGRWLQNDVYYSELWDQFIIISEPAILDERQGLGRDVTEHQGFPGLARRYYETRVDDNYSGAWDWSHYLNNCISDFKLVYIGPLELPVECL